MLLAQASCPLQGSFPLLLAVFKVKASRNLAFFSLPRYENLLSASSYTQASGRLRSSSQLGH